MYGSIVCFPIVALLESPAPHLPLTVLAIALVQCFGGTDLSINGQFRRLAALHPERSAEVVYVYTSVESRLFTSRTSRPLDQDRHFLPTHGPFLSSESQPDCSSMTISPGAGMHVGVRPMQLRSLRAWTKSGPCFFESGG